VPPRHVRYGLDVMRSRSETWRAGLRSFLTTPSRARTHVVAGGHFVGVIVINVLVFAGPVTWGLVTAVAVATTLLIVISAFVLVVDSTGAVTNPASVLARRPIALTARSREQISLDHITPERRRRMWVGFRIGLTVVVLSAAIVVAVAVLSHH
jgi:hypothetical protein